MPKRNDISTILIIGSGPIVIGQACEFDYAGTQALKALREEGFRIVLVNSNPATIMTDPEMADVTYIEPITAEVIEKIIAQERPDCLLPTLGGQTALNTTLALAKNGVLEKYQVALIGASIEAIELAENRALFQVAMQSIGLNVPWSIGFRNLAEAKAKMNTLPYPVVLRSSYTLGGSGALIAQTAEQFFKACEEAFAHADQLVMVDEALIGWKEFELEVVRDSKDNCIVVCGIENIDPLGIHTGDSITCAPIQTLTDKEYQAMRQAAFQILRKIGVDTGGSNVQFAVHPKTGKMVVIEMNPRVSRSSALVSKATGFPIAKVAAKLAVGYTLDELKNDITGDKLPASFEPSIDYVVVKIPRFNADKFIESSGPRGPKMHSIGEVMGMGRTFAEALQKAMRSLETGQTGFGRAVSQITQEELVNCLKISSPTQLWAVAEAFRCGLDIASVNALTHIDPWFLHQVQTIIEMEAALIKKPSKPFSREELLNYKRWGFADVELANILEISPVLMVENRNAHDLQPVYKRVDSCAGEFETSTAYLYSTYGELCESKPGNAEKILIIGSGPNRIGQGIEFDYCCVQAAKAIKQLGYETIMLNCNPETVSTDYDVVDRLYCTPLTAEDVLAIIRLEKPLGVLVQYGGQTPLLLTEALADAGVNLLGVDLETVTTTEDRQRFRNFLAAIDLKQPKNAIVHNLKEAEIAAKTLGFPLILRPSFVLGGASMFIVNDMHALMQRVEKLFRTTSDALLLEQFLMDATEVDVDAISDGESVFIPALLQHIETAGVHSGDSACITPPVSLSKVLQNKIICQTQQIAQALKIRGAFNIQFAIQQDELYVIEVNPRVSRTLPFLCKATGEPLVQIATNCVLNLTFAMQGVSTQTRTLPYFCVKEAVLPFDKFNALPRLSPEMKSTGEVMGIGFTKAEAYAKAQIAASNPLPKPGNVWLVADACHLMHLLPLATELNKLGFAIYTSAKCGEFLTANHIACEVKEAVDDLHVVLIMVLVNLISPSDDLLKAARFALTHKLCYTTTREAAFALMEAIRFDLQSGEYSYVPLQARYKTLGKTSISFNNIERKN